MDVRCDKCLTVYDFDEALIPSSGVTVQCTACGLIFLVTHHRATAQTDFATVGVTHPGPAARNLESSFEHATNTPVDNPAVPPAHTWRLRTRASDESWPVTDWAMLRSWILEGRALPDDELCRDGKTWQRLDQVAELGGLYGPPSGPERPRQATELLFGPPGPRPLAHIRTMPGIAPQQPVSVAAPVQRSRETDALLPRPAAIDTLNEATPLPLPPEFPGHLGDVLPDPQPPVAAPYPSTVVAATARAPVVIPVAESAAIPTSLLTRERRRRPLLPAALVVGLLAASAIAATLWMNHRNDAPTSPASQAQAACQRAAQHFLLDSDDQLHRATKEYADARRLDPASVAAVAGLAETEALWGSYLAADAQAASAPGPAASLRELAQLHLEDARRDGEEAVRLGPQDPDAHRALAAALIAGDGSATDAAAHLDQAAAGRPDDAAIPWLRALIYLHEDRRPQAEHALTQANALARAATGNTLLRADFLLAELARAEGRTDAARATLDRILARNPSHLRAQVMRSQLAPERATSVGSGAVSDGAGAPPADAGATEAAHHAHDTGAPRTTAALIAEGNRLLHRGRSKEARRIFEQLLAASPDDLEATMGLGYCLLDTERYAAAAERFQRVLDLSPRHGDALIGLAEVYKTRGEAARALEIYRRYVREFPSGSSHEMAERNIRDLEYDLKHPKNTTTSEPNPAGVQPAEPARPTP